MMPPSEWAARRVLVTGATGMVGSWLVRRLLDEGAQVVAFVRDADPQAELIRSGTVNETTVVNGRVEDYSAVERAIVDNDVDTVFHLAAQTIVGTALRAPRATLEANVAGTWNILDVARLQPDLVARVVIASSDKAYGEADVLPYTEGTRLAGRGPYDVSKSCADLITHSYAVSYAVPAVITRCGNVYGGGDLNWSRLVPGTIRSLLAESQPILRSDGTFLRDYVYVEDVVDAYLLMADHAGDPAVRGGAFNVSDEAPKTVLDMYTAVCKAVGLGEVDPLILGKAVGEIHDQWLDSTKARDMLGWRPRYGLDEGLARTVGWYRDHFDRKVRA